VHPTSQDGLPLSNGHKLQIFFTNNKTTNFSDVLIKIADDEKVYDHRNNGVLPSAMSADGFTSLFKDFGMLP
jgi:hypothetical protein